MVHAIKQLVPRTYWTVYGKDDGRNHFCIWKMWLGRCYRVIDFPFEQAGH